MGTDSGDEGRRGYLLLRATVPAVQKAMRWSQEEQNTGERRR